jgi:serpin B
MKTLFCAFALIAALGAASLAAAQTPPSPPNQAPAGNAADHLVREQLLAVSQSKLAFELIEQLTEHGNLDVAVSPASLASVFAVLSEGADPPMKAAMAKALGFEAPESASLAALADVRTALLAGNGESLQSVDRIVLAPGSTPAPGLLARLDSLGVTHSIEDLTRPEVVAEIDAWIKEVTKGAIPDILGGPLDKPSFVALNALHFKGRWKTAFDPKLTAPKQFTGADGKRVETAMMHLPEGQRAFQTDKRFIGIDLPFSDERFSLVVITTTDKPAMAKEFARVGGWFSGEGFATRLGDLVLPRFKLSERSELLPALDVLGLEQARRSPAALGGFGSGNLSRVEQRAMIEVDEEGAEAAAATTAIVTTSAVDPSLRMIVDQPFMFSLRERGTGLILLAGYLGHPPAQVPP